MPEEGTPVGNKIVRTAPASAIDVRVRGLRKIKTLYSLLGVKSDADDESIAIAYRKAVKAYHPDLYGRDQQAESRFREIIAAVAILRDPDRRAAYDRKLRLERRRRRVAAAILYAVAGVIVSAGLVSGRLALFSTPPRIALQGEASIAAPAPSEQPHETQVQTAPDPESSVERKPDTPVTASGDAVVERNSARPDSAGENPVAPSVSSTEPSPRHLEASEIALLVKRGTELVVNGNIGAARLMFQRAAEAGDPTAAWVLAETYDPLVLQKLGVKGILPDIALAQQWYEKARALGSTATPGQLVAHVPR